MNALQDYTESVERGSERESEEEEAEIEEKRGKTRREEGEEKSWACASRRIRPRWQPIAFYELTCVYVCLCLCVYVCVYVCVC